MKFRYKKYAPGVLRPVIPIEVIYNDKAVPYEVMVDSGSDNDIFVVKFDLLKEEIEIKPRVKF